MSRIIDFSKAQIGKPYVFGRSGPSSFDCSGLTLRAVAQIGLAFYHGATTQWLRGHQTGPPERFGYWGESGTIDTLPKEKAAFLFHQDDSGKMAHTGIYDGAGGAIQAGGQYKGVSHKPLNRKRWSHWAILNEEWRAKDMAGTDTALRKGSVGEAVRQVQVALTALGYDLGQWGADGKFGAATEAAVRRFQADHSLPVTGIWTPSEAQALDTELEDELGPQANDDHVTVARAEIEAVIAQLQAMIAK